MLASYDRLNPAVTCLMDEIVKEEDAHVFRLLNWASTYVAVHGHLRDERHLLVLVIGGFLECLNMWVVKIGIN